MLPDKYLPEFPRGPEVSHLEAAKDLADQVSRVIKERRKSDKLYTVDGLLDFGESWGMLKGHLTGTLVNIEGIPVQLDEIRDTSDKRKVFHVHSREPLSRTAPTQCGFNIRIFTEIDRADPEVVKPVSFSAQFDDPALADKKAPELLAITIRKLSQIDS